MPCAFVVAEAVKEWLVENNTEGQDGSMYSGMCYGCVWFWWYVFDDTVLCGVCCVVCVVWYVLCGVCCVVCVVWYVLCGMCCVLCVMCFVCYVLCVVFCVLCVVCSMWCELTEPPPPPSCTTTIDTIAMHIHTNDAYTPIHLTTPTALHRNDATYAAEGDR
jgi:hypothetical protein